MNPLLSRATPAVVKPKTQPERLANFIVRLKELPPLDHGALAGGHVKTFGLSPAPPKVAGPDLARWEERHRTAPRVVAGSQVDRVTGRYVRPAPPRIETFHTAKCRTQLEDPGNGCVCRPPAVAEVVR